jgi:hypothetical protein
VWRFTGTVLRYTGDLREAYIAATGHWRHHRDALDEIIPARSA